jgi:hypothetical protein
VVITTAADVTLRTYDNLAKAPTASSATGFAPLLLTWTQVTSAASPLALTINDAGKAYEADTTGGNIEFDLPSAASVGNGKGFVFKKTAAANSMIIDPNGSETIDDVSVSLTVTAKDTVIGIFSNGAEWYTVTGYGLFRIVDSLTEDTAPNPAADFIPHYDASAGTEKKVKMSSYLLPGAVVAIIEDQKTAGTHGGTATSGADQTRTLNTLVYNRNSIASLASNQFTLPAGDWEIAWEAPAYQAGGHQTLLYNATAAAEVKRGTPQQADTATQTDIRSVGSTRITLAAAAAFEIRHRVAVTKSTTGFGVAGGFGTEVYTRVTVRAG